MSTQAEVISINEYDYELPKELIAQVPSEKRENCKMMVLDKEKKTFFHKMKTPLKIIKLRAL